MIDKTGSMHDATIATYLVCQNLSNFHAVHRSYIMYMFSLLRLPREPFGVFINNCSEEDFFLMDLNNCN